MQRYTPTACRAFPALVDPMSELGALDEMERLALTQVAAARQRKREILSKDMAFQSPEDWGEDPGHAGRGFYGALTIVG